MSVAPSSRPVLLVLASTYPRWRDDHEPAFVHELCKRLAQRFRVIAVVPDADGADASGELDGVEVRRFRYAPRRLETLVNDGGIVANLRRSPWKWLLLPGFALAQFLEARRVLRSRHVDAIHAHWLLPQGLLAQWLALRHGVPFVVTSHGGDLYGLRTPLLVRLKRRVAAGSAAMSVVSAAMLAEARAQGVHARGMSVLPMGVDLASRFCPDHSVQRDDDRLLFVGRLVAKKGVRYLLEAMPRVVAQRPGVRLGIVGFGPEEEALRRRASELGIAGHVEFLGPRRQAELPGLYRGAALFVAPFVRDASGDQEGLPVALMEAIGCGCPVLAGNVAGIHELLGPSAAEVVIDPEKAGPLASRILDELAQPAHARERAEQRRLALGRKVDWQVIADGYARWIEASCLQTSETPR